MANFETKKEHDFIRRYRFDSAFALAILGFLWCPMGHGGSLWGIRGSETFQKQGAGDGYRRKFKQQAVFNPCRSWPTSAAELVCPD
jgi:hypothetical protein